MAAPTSAVLQATKRASRYWPLHHQLQTAVRAAYSSDALPSSQDPLADLNSMPGRLDTMALQVALKHCNA